MQSTNLHTSTIFANTQALVKIIYGEPASKANSRRLVRFGNMSRLIKSEKALTYSDMFREQAQPLDEMLEGDLKVTLFIYYASRRPDLDESLILDLMQDRVYVNDRQVKERHIYWRLDPANPRAEIIVEKMDEVAPQKKPRRKAGAKGGEATA